MEHDDPLEMVKQLREWVDRKFQFLTAVPPDEAEKTEARERLREITKLITLHEKLGYPIPEHIRSEKTELEEYLNAPNAEENELNSMAKQLSSLAKEINHRLRDKRPRAPNQKRAPGKKIRVTFTDGAAICENKATDTFVKAVQHIGLKRVSELPVRLNGHPLVQNHPSSGLQVRELDGYYLQTHSNTEQKAQCIRQIAAALRIEISVEVMETLK